MSNYPVQDFIFKHAPWTSIFHARKHYGYEWKWLFKAWRNSTGGQDKVFGGTKTRTEDFYSQCAHRSYEECVLYACVFGTCTVLWHPTRGNVGGAGRPGCPCDDMDEPRDLERGPIR